MQTIIRLPQKRSDLELANIGSFVVDKLINYSDFADHIIKTFSKYEHIVGYISECKLKGQIYYVKTFPENEPYEQAEIREFICFGVDYGINPLFFRVDQNWNNFQYPKLHDSETLEFIKKHLPLLSGTITSDTRFPSIILDQVELNDISDLLSNKSIDRNIFNHLYLFSTNYYSKSYFLSETGGVHEYKSEKLTPSKFDFVAWVDNELVNIFNPKFDD